jgi:23S rRNA (cytosine1962-C5)-methyltransferase
MPREPLATALPDVADAALQDRERDVRLGVLAMPGFADYALIDSGEGRKLERFGDLTTDRPEPQAMWRPARDAALWRRADARFKAKGEGDEEGGRWHTDKPLPPSWPLRVAGVTLHCRLTAIRHVGIFPEQLAHWQWMQRFLQARAGETPRVLNLFAYTGAASLIAAAAGAEVTHVDASQTAIAWAKQNQAASGLGAAPIRWILEDARKFTAREVRRGKSYHLILIDPPKFGRGPAGEVWEIFDHLTALLRDCARLLAGAPAGLVLTSYALRASALAFGELLAECMDKRPGVLDAGELVISEQSAGRLLPTSHYARWIAHATP